MRTWLIRTEWKTPGVGDIVIPPNGVLTVIPPATCSTAGNVVGVEPAELVSEDVVAVGRMVRGASTVIVTRASEHARELAKNPACASPSLGKDTVNIKLELDPENADLLLRYIGGRS